MTDRSKPLDSDDPSSGFAVTVQDSLPTDISLPFAESAPAEDNPATASTDGEPTIGHVGRYALKRLIGEGGLGTVYAAWDPILSRAVAVKTLNLQASGADRATLDNLFVHEARAVAGLSHPHIVTVFDAGVDERLGAYLAMEHLSGQDLRQMLVEGWQPSPAQAARLVRRVADAATYSHGMGVYHCDIKPANVFMVDRRRPKVLDFGIARLARERAREGQVGLPSAGSPQYAAPEQLRGGSADARTDVHALGVLLYELLARRKAFEGQTLAELESAVLGARPVSAHQVRPEVPADLSRIAERAMALEPAARFASARDLSRALRRWNDEHATGAQRAVPIQGAATASGASSATLDPGRRTGLRWAVAAAMLAVTGGIAWKHLAGPGNSPGTAVATAPVVSLPAQTPPPPPAAGSAVLATPAADASRAVDTSPPALPAALAATPPAVPPTTNPPPAAVTARPARPGARLREQDTRAIETPVVASTAITTPAPPAQGLVQFAVAPWGQVEVDGKSVGTTPPLTRLSLPEGEHVIVVRNADFAPHSVTIRVSAEQPVNIRHRFGS
ncbi:MAG: serine/threonine-protein kinase [Aquabacterium sp.]